MRRIRLTPSFAVAVLALVIATAGTATAAHYIITSTKQIKPSVRRALKGKRGPKGYDGVRGAQGVQGVQGVPGSAGILGLTTVDGAARTYASGEYGAPPDAQCPAGSTVVGTGFNGPFSVVGGFVKKYGTFVGGFFENDSSISLQGSVQAICAQLPAGAPSTRSVSSARSQYQDDVASAARAAAAARGY